MLQQTVIVACGMCELEQALAQANQDRPHDAPVCVIGLTRYLPASCWRICFLWPSAPLMWVSNHRRKADAETQIRRLLLLSEGGISDDATFTSAMQDLATYSDADLGDLEAHQRQYKLDCKNRYRDRHA